MKNKWLLALLTIICAVSLVACSDNTKTPPVDTDKPVTGITISADTLTLKLGSSNVTATLTASISPADATETEVTWTSSKPAVATVLGGVVTAVSAGTTTVTAKIGEFEDSCAVTVQAADVLPVISVGNNSYSIAKGSTDLIHLDFSVTGTPTPVVTISGDESLIIDNEARTVALTQDTDADTYTITVSATNDAGTVVETVEIEVYEISTPTLTLVSEPIATVSLQGTGGANYTLDYSVTGTNTSVEITCDKQTYIYDTTSKVISMFSAGVYRFTLIATNSAGNDSETVEITVTDTYAKATVPSGQMLFTNTMDAASAEMTEVKTGTGAIAYDNGKAVISTTANNSSAFLQKNFDEPLSGIVVVEEKFSYSNDNNTSTTRFVNLMFLHGSNVSETAVTNFGIDYNRLMFRNSTVSNWANVPYGKYFIGLNQNSEYTVRVVNDFTAKVSHLYLSGSAVNLLDGDNAVVASQTLDAEIYLGSFAFRSPDRAASVLRMGTDKANVTLNVDDVKVYSLTPVVTVGEATKTILEFVNSADYTLDYNASANTVITCADANGEPILSGSGWAMDGDVVTFTASGTYVFNIVSTNAFGSASKTITVTVSDKVQVAPEVTITSQAANASVQEGVTYTLQYTVSATTFPTAQTAVTVDCDPMHYSYDEESGVLTFFSSGVYTITVEATNTAGSDSDTVVVTVTDDFAVSAVEEIKKMYYEDFSSTTKPDDLTETISDSATITYEGGKAVMVRPGSGKAFLAKSFDEPLSGVVVTEQTFSVTGTGFANIMFFMTADSNTSVTNIAVNSNRLVYRTGSSWSLVQYNGASIGIIDGEQYTLRTVNDFDAKITYVYIIGKISRNDIGVALDREIYVGSYAFRNPNHVAQMFRFGSDNTITTIEMDDIKIYTLMPVIAVNESNGIVEGLTDSKDYELDFESGSETVDITCDVADGWSILNKTVTFTAAGTYVFTLKSENAYGEVTKTVTVIVTNTVEGSPIINVTSGKSVVTLLVNGTASYQLAFTVSGNPAPTVAATSATAGFAYAADTKIVTFTQAGKFVITVTATNDKGEATDTVTVEVVDPANVTDAVKELLYSADFNGDTAPEGLDVKSGNGGTATYADGKVTIQKGVGNSASSGYVYMDKAFNDGLTGLVVVEEKFVLNTVSSANGFVNIMFLTNEDGKTSTACIAIDKGVLKYHSGSGWKSALYNEVAINMVAGVEYTLRTVNDMVNKTTHVYLSGAKISQNGEEVALTGEIYCGSYAFRTPNQTPVNLRIGSDNGAVDFSVGDVKIYRLKVSE